MERVTAIVEVKGIWNADVAQAMKTQLVDRYLSETGIENGLHVVGGTPAAVGHRRLPVETKPVLLVY